MKQNYLLCNNIKFIAKLSSSFSIILWISLSNRHWLSHWFTFDWIFIMGRYTRYTTGLMTHKPSVYRYRRKFSQGSIYFYQRRKNVLFPNLGWWLARKVLFKKMWCIDIPGKVPQKVLVAFSFPFGNCIYILQGYPSEMRLYTDVRKQGAWWKKSPSPPAPV